MIIVTGGAGFIGSNIIKKLNYYGYNNILVVDNLANNIKYVNLISLNIVDYMDKKDFLYNITTNGNIFGNIDVVFHQGACTSTIENNSKYLLFNNFEYSKKILYFCMKKKIPFIYASSSAVYGNRINNFIEDRHYEHPLNVYGYSKFIFDQYVRTLLPIAESQICGLRYFNVYGPGEKHKENMASVIFNFNCQINSDTNIKLFTGSNNFKRDFVYISDVIEVNLWFWANNISGIFNCGTGKSESYNSIANMVLNYYKKGCIEYINFPNNLKGKYQSYTQADLTQLRYSGYIKLFKTITEGVNEYLNWLNL